MIENNVRYQKTHKDKPKQGKSPKTNHNLQNSNERFKTTSKNSNQKFTCLSSKDRNHESSKISVQMNYESIQLRLKSKGNKKKIESLFAELLNDKS